MQKPFPPAANTATLSHHRLSIIKNDLIMLRRGRGWTEPSKASKAPSSQLHIMEKWYASSVELRCSFLTSPSSDVLSGRNDAMLCYAKSLQSCPTLCDPIDGSPPDSPVPGILQARTLEWVAIAFSNAWKWKVKVKSLSRGSSVHGIFQARVLEWVAIAFS